jgi:Spy/CpxP family protein refolding chaperone
VGRAGPPIARRDPLPFLFEVSMNARITCLVALALVALVATSSFAQEKKKKNAGPPQQVAQMIKKTEGLGLSEEQTKKVKEIAESYTPKFREVNQKLNAVLTAEQKKARQEAQAKNKADGKKGKEAQAAIEAASNLTDEQKKVQSEVQASQKELSAKFREEVVSVLTPEQKEKFAPPKKAKAK